MAKGVNGARFGKKATVGVARTLTDHDNAVIVFFYALPDSLKKGAFLERNLREKDDVWGITRR